MVSEGLSHFSQNGRRLCGPKRAARLVIVASRSRVPRTSITTNGKSIITIAGR
jgi:hypothetical protein